MSQDRRAPLAPIAVIRSESPSLWGSCKTIVPNLEAAYRPAQKAQFFSFEPGMDPSRVWALAESIARSRPERIVFLDHLPHPAELLGALAEVYGKRPLPPVAAHLYGDFTLHTDAWLGIEPLLRKSGLQLLCASERQGRLVSRFLRAPAKTLAICPFPTDASLFAPDAAAGARWRKRLGIAASDFLICYSGRLSLQKNVLRLIREFVLLRKWGKIPVHLVLAGPFDDLGAPMFGIETPRYFYFQQFEALLAGLDPDDRAAVHYVGNLESGELRALYNAADCYASLSLHHDEDYGMAPAEALLCGTPVLLTDWGGYASFGGYAVPVVLGKKGLRVKSAHVQRGFLEMWMRRPSRESRRALSLEFGNRISIPAVARRLRELLGQPIARFQGFAPLMKQLSRASVFCEGAPFQSGAGKGALYERIYEAYLTGSRF